MILHGNLSQAYNSLENGEKSLFHIDQAIALSKQLDTKTHFEKFIYRKAKALSFNSDRLKEAMECITSEYEGIDLNDSKDQAMKAIIKTIWNKMLQKEGSYDFFEIYQQ